MNPTQGERLADLPWPRLEVRCSRCPRRGLIRQATLIRQYGPDATLTELRRILPGDCPNRTADMLRGRCDVFYPQLSR